MILINVYDKLSTQHDYLQCVESEAIIKRELLLTYKNLVSKKDITNLEKFKDSYIKFVGEYTNGVLTVYDKDKMRDISLTDYLGVSEVKANEKDI